jgi:hypothetical protein
VVQSPVLVECLRFVTDCADARCGTKPFGSSLEGLNEVQPGWVRAIGVPCGRSHPRYLPKSTQDQDAATPPESEAVARAR